MYIIFLLPTYYRFLKPKFHLTLNFFFRDTTIYAASVSRDKVDALLELLGDTVFQPTLDEETIAQVHEIIHFELQELDKKPDPEPMMTELIHEVFFINFL